MRAIETTATVAEDGTVTIDGTVTVAPGRHLVVLVLDEQTTGSEAEAQDASGWPPGYFKQTYGALAHDPLTRDDSQLEQALQAQADTGHGGR